MNDERIHYRSVCFKCPRKGLDAIEEFASTVQDMAIEKGTAWAFLFGDRLVCLSRFFSRFRGKRLDMHEDALVIGMYTASVNAIDIIDDVKFVISKMEKVDGQGI